MNRPAQCPRGILETSRLDTSTYLFLANPKRQASYGYYPYLHRNFHIGRVIQSMSALNPRWRSIP